MKRYYLFLSVFIFLLTSNQSAIAASEVWKVTSLNWQPYAGPNMQNDGRSIHKLRQILAKADIELVIEFYPWARAKQLALTEEYVGYFPTWPEDVHDGFVGSDPVDYSHLGIMTTYDSEIRWNNIDDIFKYYKVGLLGTYTYPEKINSLMSQNPEAIDIAPNELSLVRKLSRGRNDVALTDPAVMLHRAAKERIYNIKVLLPNVEKKALLLSFSKSKENLRKMKVLNDLLLQYSFD